MIVYGDSGREEALGSIIDSLRATLARAEESARQGSVPGCDTVRRLLIQAGELEHAARESPPSLGPPEASRQFLRALRTATALAARAFVLGCDPSLDTAGDTRIGTALRRMRRVLDGLRPLNRATARIWVDVPEGFSVLALFPEEARARALQWASRRELSSSRDVLVLGIGGIGTTLSAVIAATLRARGFRVWLLGDVSAPSSVRRPPAACGLVATVSSHAPELGPAKERLRTEGASDVEVLEIPSPNGSLERAQIGARSLVEALWGSIEALHGDPLVRVAACGGGAWREHRASEWDRGLEEVSRHLERPKLLCEGASGRKVLFKFAGLASAPGSAASMAEVHARQIERVAREGLTPAPLGIAHGFVATPWIEGRPLRASDASPDLLRRIGGYIATAAGPPLSSSSARAARVRLETMLCQNASEALGGDAAIAATALLRPIPILEELPRAGDGHLAPHEWIESPDGRIFKTDAGGHDLDPLWTGRQPVLWDLAGAILEWDLDELRTAALLEGFLAAGGARCAPMPLSAYRAAYAAHRLGQLRHGADVEEDPVGRVGLEQGYQRWRAVLASHLGVSSPPSGEELRVPEGASPFQEGFGTRAPLATESDSEPASRSA